MDNNSTEVDSEHPMDVEMNMEVLEHLDRPISPVLASISYTHQHDQEIISNHSDERSRSPISTQRSSISLFSDSDLGECESNTPSVNEDVVPVEDNPEKSECTCKQKKPRNPSDEFDDEEGKLCPICLDVWTTSGSHRVCAIRCGHLFGHSCLERWLNGQKTCPTCKRTVKKTDIRFIYAKKLIAIDTTELNVLRLELDSERIERNKLQFELIQSRQRDLLNQKEIIDLKKQITILKASSRFFNSSQGTVIRTNWKIYKEKYFEVNKEGGCRVMDFYKLSNILVASSQSPNPLFSGYGVRKVQVNDLKSSCYIPLHSGTIRDLSFHPQRELLLSVSVDKCARLTETANSKSVHTVQCSGPAWACCWDATNPNYFYVGEQSGTTVKYDIRRPNDKLYSFQVPGEFSPVVSLASAGWAPGGNLPQGGLFICKLNSCSLFTENTQTSDYSMHSLCLDGPFVSMRYDNITGHLLVTSRPNLRNPFARHTLCTIGKGLTSENITTFSCNTVQIFKGAPVQKLLSRSCQMNVVGDVLISAHHETNKVVDIWSVSNGKKVSSLPAHSPVLDLCPIVTENAQYLCSLNDKKVDFFKLELS